MLALQGGMYCDFLFPGSPFKLACARGSSIAVPRFFLGSANERGPGYFSLNAPSGGVTCQTDQDGVKAVFLRMVILWITENV
jgi:hypothetical protein